MNNSRFSGDSGGAGRAGDQEPCATCGGDGRIENAWGQRATCPSCTTFRVRVVPWTVSSRPGDTPASAVKVWECLGCGHVWREPLARTASPTQAAGA